MGQEFDRHYNERGKGERERARDELTSKFASTEWPK
jgi:hypothetical protein